MNERRRRRSHKAHEAVKLFLESVIAREGLDAMALTTDDGLLVGGAGREVDVEWMGALGASSPRATFTWDSRTVHVSRLSLNNVFLCLTTAGRPANVSQVTAGLARILAA